MGKGTYILFTCRYFEGDDDQYTITKTMSTKIEKWIMLFHLINQW